MVSVMLHSPEMVQRQISDAISIIGKKDFPNDWTGLLAELSAQLNSTDFRAINGALQTAHSLFKKYRCVVGFGGNGDILFVIIHSSNIVFVLYTSVLRLLALHGANTSCSHSGLRPSLWRKVTFDIPS